MHYLFTDRVRNEIVDFITTVRISETIQISGTKSSVNIMCIWSNNTILLRQIFLHTKIIIWISFTYSSIDDINIYPLFSYLTMLVKMILYLIASNECLNTNTFSCAPKIFSMNQKLYETGKELVFRHFTLSFIPFEKDKCYNNMQMYVIMFWIPLWFCWHISFNTLLLFLSVC